MTTLNVAVVLTCFNRKEKTATCLTALQDAAERMGNSVQLHIIVTDDGSTDGTGEMLRSSFPNVEVLSGNGKLFWNGGMRLAFGRALEQTHDFYLWVNDDTILLPDFLERILDTHKNLVATFGSGGLVVGSTCNDAGKVSYGGLRRLSANKLLKFQLVEPSEISQPCDTNNGNCLLISAHAAQVLGNLDIAFVHGMGDLDYGLRATELGIPIWVMPGFVGSCNHDHAVEGSYLDCSLPLAVRWKKALSPKELNPHSWSVFCRRHAGFWWPLYWIWPYAKIVLTSLIPKRLSSDQV